MYISWYTRGKMEKSIDQHKVPVKGEAPPKPGRLSKRRTAMRFRRIQIMIHKGMTADEIAGKLGLKNKTSVFAIMKSDYFKDGAKEVNRDAIAKAREIFELNAVAAATKVAQLLMRGDNKQRIQLDAAREILHQVGLKPVEVIETRRRDYSPEEISSARATVLEIETITNRLDAKESKFIVEKRDQGIVANVNADGPIDKTSTTGP